MAITNDYILKGGLRSSDEAANNRLRSMDEERMQKADQDAKLAQLIKGKQMEGANEASKLAQQQQIANDASKQAQDYVESERKAGRKVSASFGPQGAAISVGDQLPRDMTRHDAQVDKGTEAYSKRLEKLNGFDSALDEIEKATNRDGSGGIVTNGSAKTISSGGMKSLIPSGASGLAELVGALPKGATEERKSLERLQIEYQKAMSGMRVTDQARAQEKAAMGYIASGDPALVAKGVRALAQNVRNAHKTIGAGYNDEVRAAYRQRAGDPDARYANIYEDSPPATTSGGGGMMPPADAIQAEIQRRLGGRR